MLRSVLLLLLLANGAYYAWAQGLLLPLGLAPVQQREPERLARQIRPEAVRLVPADEAVKSEAPKTEPATVAAKAPDCLQAAPLDDATTEAVRRVLASWPAASVRITVSSGSLVMSAVGSTVIVAVELPAPNVTVPFGGTNVAAPVCV